MPAILWLAHAQAAAPTAGGTFLYVQSAFPPCLDVAQSARQQNATRQILDTLLDQDKRTGASIPWLATAWSYEDGGKRLVLTLRHGVTFSNGEPFNAAAVKANFDNLAALAKQGRAGQAGSYLSGYQGADVIAPDKVALRFDSPKAGFLQALSEKTLAPLAPATLAESPDKRCQGDLIATGPFVISQVVQNQRIVLKKRPDYAWPSPNAEHGGPAYLDTITFQTVAEEGVRVGMLTSGQANAVDDISVDDLSQLKSADAHILERNAGGIGLTLYPNLARPIVRDVAVRQALTLAINRQEIIHALYTPYERAATSVLSSGVPDYVDQGQALAYRPADAKAILDKAGWKPGPDGIRVKDGQRLQLNVIWSFAGLTPTLELIKEQLNQVGIALQLNQKTDAEIGGIVRAGNYDLRMSDLTRPDPDVLMTIFSTRFGPGLGAPLPTLDALLDQQSATVDPKARAALVAQIQQIIVSQGYAIPIKESSTLVATAKNVSGLWLSTPRWPVLYDTHLDAP